MGRYFSNRPLDKLTDKEEQWLSSLESQHAKGRDLAPEDSEALAEYWQLQIESQTPDLAKFRMDWQATYFRPWGDGIELERIKYFNYPAKVECYKQKHQHRTTARSVRQLIEDERKEQLGLKEQARHTAKLQSGDDEVQIKYDLIERVYDEYEQFLAAEIERIETTLIAATLLDNDEAAIKTPIKKVNNRELKIAKLAHGITQDEVHKLLTGAGMGKMYTKPGEWAAAFRALHVANVLEGTAPAVTRWATGQGYVEDSAKETIKKVWSEERNEAKQFSNTNQKTAFRNTLNAANTLLTTSKLRSSIE